MSVDPLLDDAIDPAAVAVEESANEFPMGWEQRFTATGVMYFVDHINRTTTVGRFLSSHHCPALPLCLPHGPRPALTPSALPVV